MNTQRNVTRSLEEQIANTGVPPCGDQVPPEKDVNDDQALINILPLKHGDIRVDFFHRDQAITTEAQAATSEALDMTTQAT